MYRLRNSQALPSWTRLIQAQRMTSYHRTALAGWDIECPVSQKLLFDTTYRLSLFAHVRDHFVNDHPSVIDLMKRQELIIIKLIHFDIYFGNCYGVDHINR